MIDMLSVERNVLLVNLSLIGGADEKQTPSRLVSPDVIEASSYFK